MKENFTYSKKRGKNMKLECKIFDELHEKMINDMQQENKRKQQNVVSVGVQSDLIVGQLSKIIESIHFPYDSIKIENEKDFVQFKFS